MMNYLEARSAATKGNAIKETSWDNCRKVRTWKDSDADFVGVQSPDALIEDCPKACDCAIRIYIPTKAEYDSENWEIVAPDVQVSDTTDGDSKNEAK